MKRRLLVHVVKSHFVLPTGSHSSLVACGQHSRLWWSFVFGKDMQWINPTVNFLPFRLSLCTLVVICFSRVCVINCLYVIGFSYLVIIYMLISGEIFATFKWIIHLLYSFKHCFFRRIHSFFLKNNFCSYNAGSV